MKLVGFKNQRNSSGSGYHKCCILIPVLGVFSLGVPVDDLFFIGNQLVATSHTGKVGVWNAVTQHWQVGIVSERLLNASIHLYTCLSYYVFPLILFYLPL